MNTWTNWYGAVGLISTIGKHGFAAGEIVSNKAQGTYQTIREKLIELKMDVALVGEIKVFESLENVSKWSAEKAKSYQVKCEEWETWAQQKFEQAKAQEELNEEWRKNVNSEHSLAQKTTYQKISNLVQEKRQKYFPEKRWTRGEETYRPNCLRFVGIIY